MKRLRILEYTAGPRTPLATMYSRNTVRGRLGPVREYRVDSGQCVSFWTRVWLAWRVLLGRDYD